MEAEAWPDPARPAPPLQQVGLAGPGGGVVRHVVVRREQLDLGLAAVNDVHHVLDGDAGLGDVGADDDLGDAGRHLFEHCALVLARQLRVERDEAVARAPEHGVLLQVLQEAEDLGPAGQEDQDSARDGEGFDIVQQRGDKVEWNFILANQGHRIRHRLWISVSAGGVEVFLLLLHHLLVLLVILSSVLLLLLLSLLLHGLRDEVRHLDAVLEEVLLHGVDPARHLHHGAAAEVAAEERGVDGGGHEHDPELGVGVHHVAQQHQQEVAVHISLVDLILIKLQ